MYITIICTIAIAVVISGNPASIIICSVYIGIVYYVTET